MARFVVKTPFDSVDCDAFLVVTENMIEVGYKKCGKFMHEIIRTDYARIIDNSPSITEDEFMDAVKEQTGELEGDQPKQMIVIDEDGEETMAYPLEEAPLDNSEMYR
jgi:hypothetical protein